MSNTSQPNRSNRRDFLKLAGGAGAAALLSGCANVFVEETPSGTTVGDYGFFLGDPATNYDAGGVATPADASATYAELKQFKKGVIVDPGLITPTVAHAMGIKKVIANASLYNLSEDSTNGLSIIQQAPGKGWTLQFPTLPVSGAPYAQDRLPWYASNFPIDIRNKDAQEAMRQYLFSLVDTYDGINISDLFTAVFQEQYQHDEKLSDPALTSFDGLTDAALDLMATVAAYAKSKNKTVIIQGATNARWDAADPTKRDPLSEVMKMADVACVTGITTSPSGRQGQSPYFSFCNWGAAAVTDDTKTKLTTAIKNANADPAIKKNDFEILGLEAYIVDSPNPDSQNPSQQLCTVQANYNNLFKGIESTTTGVKISSSVFFAGDEALSSCYAGLPPKPLANVDMLAANLKLITQPTVCTTR